MRLGFHGATGTVTGSKYLLQTEKASGLVEWLTQNGFWIMLFVAFIGVRMFGHGGHRGHGGHGGHSGHARGGGSREMTRECLRALAKSVGPAPLESHAEITHASHS